MRWLGWALGITLALLSASTSWAQTDVISEISVTGNRRIPAETVKGRIFTRPGDIYDPAALERDFNALWNTGYFEDIRFSREQTPKGWRLIIQVKEKPTIREINYVGKSSISDSDILDRFKEAKVGLSVESQYDPTKVKKAEVAIKGLLAEHGRQFSTIRTEIRQIPPAAVGITFVIKEGPKVKVGKIKFVGNKNVKTRVLRYAMKNLRPIGVPHSIFLESIFARTYDATKLDEDVERVRNEYQNRGYFKANVSEPKTEIHDTGHAGAHVPLLQGGSGKSVDITMPIEEGERYTLGGITFKNNKAVPNQKALRAIFTIKDGDVFSKEKVGKGLENLRKAYGELGYINFTPVPETRFDDEKKLIYLDIDVDEGKQFYVRRIEFVGNTTTRDKVIRREIALEEGSIYNSRLWELSLLRLNQLGYFDIMKPEDPNVTVRQLDEKNGLVDLTLKVHEKGRNSIGLNGGVSGLEGAFVGINYATNNFLGLGETLQVQASVGNLAKSVRFGFTQPYMFDRPLQFGFNVYYTKTKYDQARQLSIFSGQNLNLPNAVLQNLQNYTQSSAGFTTSLSYPLRARDSAVSIALESPIRSTGRRWRRSVRRPRICSSFWPSAESPGPMRSKESSPARSSPTFLSIPSTIRSRRTAGTSSRWARNSPGWEEPFGRSGRSFSTSALFRCRRGTTRWASTLQGRLSPAMADWLRLRSSALTWAARTICAVSTSAQFPRWRSCRALDRSL